MTMEELYHKISAERANERKKRMERTESEDETECKLFFVNLSIKKTSY